jgi:hypothetical protein
MLWGEHDPRAVRRCGALLPHRLRAEAGLALDRTLEARRRNSSMADWWPTSALTLHIDKTSSFGNGRPVCRLTIRPTVPATGQ